MTHRQPRWARRLRRACLFLLLGLVTTVGVAWGLTVLAPIRAGLLTTELPGVYLQRIHQRVHYDLRAYAQLACGGQRRQWMFSTPDEDPRVQPMFRPRMRQGHSVLVWTWDLAGSLRWGLLPVDRNAFLQGSEPQPGMDEGRGWPSLALWYGIRSGDIEHAGSLGRVETVGGICLTPQESASGSVLGFRALPLLPIWPGLAFNTAFYALLWWLGFASFRIVKHNRRYRRGLCPSCRYDLRADYSGGCPECGWGREAQA